ARRAATQPPSRGVRRAAGGRVRDAAQRILRLSALALTAPGGVAERLNAAVSKTVSGGFPPTRVRIPPPPSCDVSGHPGQMCRDIVDCRAAAERLIDAAWVERELAQ